MRHETEVRVGRDITLEELRKNHDAVVITAGLQGSRPLPIPGADFPRASRRFRSSRRPPTASAVDLGKRVVVVGGGNVAMDVARTARRLGAKSVAIVCLESDEEMPASAHEVEEAQLEGITVNCSWGPREVIGDENVVGLKVARCLSVFDEREAILPDV